MFFVFWQGELISELGSFGNHGKNGGRSSSGFIQSNLPFAYCLLAGAQFIGQLTLGQTQVAP